MSYWAQGQAHEVQSHKVHWQCVPCVGTGANTVIITSSLLTWKGCTLRSFADDNSIRGVPDTPDDFVAIWTGLRG